MDEHKLDNCEVVSVNGGGASVLIEKLLVELEKNVAQFELQRKLKTLENIKLYMQELDVPCMLSVSNRYNLEYEYLNNGYLRNSALSYKMSPFLRKSLGYQDIYFHLQNFTCLPFAPVAPELTYPLVSIVQHPSNLTEIVVVT